MKKTILILLFFWTIVPVQSQSTMLKENGSWITFSNKITLTDNLYISHLNQMRRVSFMKNTQINLMVSSLNYKLNKNIIVGAGYIGLKFHPYGVKHAPIKKDEHRIWQHITIKSSINKLKLSNRFMFEERFKDVINTSTTPNFIDGTSYAQRFRYRIQTYFNVFQLKNKKMILGKVSNEIRVKFNTGLSEPGFDQNNFEALLGYNLFKTSKLWIGYGRDYFKYGNDKFKRNNKLHIAMNYDFDLRSKK